MNTIEDLINNLSGIATCFIKDAAITHIASKHELTADQLLAVLGETGVSSWQSSGLETRSLNFKDRDTFNLLSYHAPGADKWGDEAEILIRVHLAPDAIALLVRDEPEDLFKVTNLEALALSGRRLRKLALLS